MLEQQARGFRETSIINRRSFASFPVKPTELAACLDFWTGSERWEELAEELLEVTAEAEHAVADFTDELRGKRPRSRFKSKKAQSS